MLFNFKFITASFFKLNGSPQLASPSGGRGETASPSGVRGKPASPFRGSGGIKIPASLDDITLGQMMALQEKEKLTDLEVISILSGVPVDELANIKNYNDLAQIKDAVNSLAYQIKYLYNSDVIPKKVSFLIDGKPKSVNVISNLAVEPAGAFMAAREIIAEEISRHIELYGEADWKSAFNPSLKACCQVLAHYFFCRATGKRYNEYEADEFSAEIKKLRVTEALPIAKHFFMSYPNLSMQKTSYWHRLQPFWKKRQASRLLKSLNISTP